LTISGAPLNNDVQTNRAAKKWSRSELVGRALWELVKVPLFSWPPRQLWFWRRAVLRLFGADIGKHVHIHPTARIEIPWNLSVGDYSAIGHAAIVYNLGHITIGRAATISQYAHLCAGTHYFRDPAMPLLKPPITIGQDAWVCADAFVGPGVVVGDGAVIAARAVVVRDVQPRAVVGGNPAVEIGRR
jgi:putative colanic acid biosynthesis acetyltransferase WcaF